MQQRMAPSHKTVQIQVKNGWCLTQRITSSHPRLYRRCNKYTFTSSHHPHTPPSHTSSSHIPLSHVSFTHHPHTPPLHTTSHTPPSHIPLTHLHTPPSHITLTCQEPNSFFVMTNLWVTCNQTYGKCAEVRL